LGDRPLGDAERCEGDVDDIKLVEQRLDDGSQAIPVILEQRFPDACAQEVEPALA
jgi:hypothetical protein